MTTVSIIGGFTAAPMLCLVGVACRLLPAAQALQGSADTFITLGTLWTVLAIVVTHIRPVGPHA